MKDQYFGDINDYRKYGLLRGIQSGGECKLLVAWMLTPDDGGRDGGFRSYLQRPEVWKHFDPELFAGLAAVLQASCTPQVSLIEGSSLLPYSTFFSAVVPDARDDRDLWRKALMKLAAGVDLVFLDPDNGIEVPSRPIGRKGSSKYVSWQEIQGIWESGCSILIYQHFHHAPREAFAACMVSELRRRTGAPFTQASTLVMFCFCWLLRQNMRLVSVKRFLTFSLGGRVKSQLTRLANKTTKPLRVPLPR